MAESNLTAERLRELLSYDPNTGLFRWIFSKSPRVKSGDIAGSECNGYIYIGICGSNYRSHRLVWLHVYGRWPAKHIDHINRIKNDNRLENLRECTDAENKQNVSIRKTNTSGYTGVTYHPRDNDWQAYITANKKRIHLGYFPTAELANSARIKAKSVHHTF